MYEKISVVIPIYNAEKYLDECIRSILNKNYPDIEVILVDDGSVDSSKLICEFYIEKYPDKVKYIYQENRGQVAARTRGIKNASGKWVMFIDADDWLIDDKDIFQILVSESIQQDVDAVLYDCCKVKGDSQNYIANLKKGIYVAKEIACDFLNTEEFYENKVITSLWGAMYKTEIMSNIMEKCPEEIRMSEDVACVWSFLAHANRIKAIEKLVYCYRIHEESFCRVHDKNLYESEKMFYTYLKNEFLDVGIFQKVEKQLIWQVVRDIMLADYKLLFHCYQDCLVPFAVFDSGCKIAIYGYGDMGQEYMRVLSESKRYKIEFLVDKNKAGLLQGINIITPEELVKNQASIDAVIILTTRYKVRREIEEYLIKLGIQKNKIVQMNVDMIQREDIEEILEIENR